MLDRGADSEFVKCFTFRYVAQTDHSLVRVSLGLADGPSLGSNWKFNTSLLEIRDFQDRLESPYQRALVEAVTGNKWWGSLKHRSRYFAIKSSRQLNLDRTKMAKTLKL